MIDSQIPRRKQRGMNSLFSDFVRPRGAGYLTRGRRRMGMQACPPGSCHRANEIVWYGSMNMLWKEDAEDNLMRVCSKDIAAELLEMTFGSKVDIQEW